jgi:hypothetical protein
MSVVPFGALPRKDAFVSFEQPWNAELPILIMPFGMVTLVMDKNTLCNA